MADAARKRAQMFSREAFVWNSLENYSVAIIGQPLVSVIMPAYNAEKYIGAAIQSVIAQTYSDWELVVVDDGSTDKTAEIVRNAAANDERIKYFAQPNGRQSKARNKGIANASGSLFAFLDADDLWVEKKLELQLQALTNSAADIVYSSGIIFRDEDPQPDSEIFPTTFGKTDGRQMFEMLLCRNSVPVTSVIMRRETLEHVGWFDETPAYQSCEDYDLWLRAAKAGASFYGMREQLFRYRRHGTAATNLGSGWRKPMLRVVQKHIRDSNLSDEGKRNRVRVYFRDLISALIDENNLTEARAYLEELSKLDSACAVTSIQKLLMVIAPRGYNFVSRHLLYRVEWHLKQLLRKNRAIRHAW